MAQGGAGGIPKRTTNSPHCDSTHWGIFTCVLRFQIPNVDLFDDRSVEETHCWSHSTQVAKAGYHPHGFAVRLCIEKRQMMRCSCTIPKGTIAARLTLTLTSVECAANWAKRARMERIDRMQWYDSRGSGVAALDHVAPSLGKCDKAIHRKRLGKIVRVGLIGLALQDCGLRLSFRPLPVVSPSGASF